MPKRLAGIDCGTNSIRLLVADVSEDGTLNDLAREMRIVRLGQGVDARGSFDEVALQRTFDAVDEYATVLARLGITPGNDCVRFVATSATRDASNRDVFLDGVQQRLGVRPEVVSGSEEANLSFVGAASVLSGAQSEPTLVVDLGGGSTEFVFGQAGGAQSSVEAAISTDMGCVRFTERFLRSDPPTQAEIAEATAAAKEFIQRAAEVVPLAQVRRLIGVAGTVTTVTAHVLGLDAYDPSRIHGARLTVEAVRKAAAELLALTRAERAALPYMHPGRVDVIGAGALLWSTIVEAVHDASAYDVETVDTSEHDILDGIVLSLA